MVIVRERRLPGKGNLLIARIHFLLFATHAATIQVQAATSVAHMQPLVSWARFCRIHITPAIAVRARCTKMRVAVPVFGSVRIVVQRVAVELEIPTAKPFADRTLLGELIRRLLLARKVHKSIRMILVHVVSHARLQKHNASNILAWSYPVNRPQADQ